MNKGLDVLQDEQVVYQFGATAPGSGHDPDADQSSDRREGWRVRVYLLGVERRALLIAPALDGASRAVAPCPMAGLMMAPAAVRSQGALAAR